MIEPVTHDNLDEVLPLIRESGEVVGFATVYFTFTTSITARVDILNDLYTLKEARGRGIGRTLIEHCRQFASDRECARLQRVTAPDNLAAQILYDSLETGSSNWTFYTYNT